MGIVIDIIVIGIVVVSAMIAYHKGFIKTFFGFVSTILAVVLACIFSGNLATYLNEETNINEWIATSILSLGGQEQSGENFEDSTVEIIEESGELIISGENESLTAIDNNDEDISMNMSTMVESLPDMLDEMFNLEEIKEDAVITIVYKLANIVINVFSWIIIYVGTKVILLIVMIVFNGIMSLPFLKEINNIAGLVIGIFMGLFRVYFILAIIYFMSNIVNIEWIVGSINQSMITAFMYNSNLLMMLIF